MAEKRKIQKGKAMWEAGRRQGLVEVVARVYFVPRNTPKERLLRLFGRGTNRPDVFETNVLLNHGDKVLIKRGGPDAGRRLVQLWTGDDSIRERNHMHGGDGELDSPARSRTTIRADRFDRMYNISAREGSVQMRVLAELIEEEKSESTAVRGNRQ